MSIRSQRDRLRVGTVLAAVSLIHASSGCLYLFGEDIAEGRHVPPGQDTFGYVSVGPVVYGDFFGNITDLDNGSGLSISVPFAPGPVVVAGVMVLAAAAGGAGGGGWGGSGGDGTSVTASRDRYASDKPEPMWHSGLSDKRRRIVSDVSFDVTFLLTWFDDYYSGTGSSRLTHTSVLLGARLGSPRMWLPRFYLSGGYGFHLFRPAIGFLSRPPASVGGPYAGFGVEFFVAEEQSIAIDTKAIFYFGDDDDGVPVDGGSVHTSITYSFYF